METVMRGKIHLSEGKKLEKQELFQDFYCLKLRILGVAI